MNEQPPMPVKTLRSQVVPAHSCAVVECRIETTEAECETPMLFEPRVDWPLENSQIILHESVICLNKGENRKIQINATNKGDKDYYFDRYQILGTLEEVKSVTPAGVISFKEGDSEVVPEINKVNVALINQKKYTGRVDKGTKS